MEGANMEDFRAMAERFKGGAPLPVDLSGPDLLEEEGEPDCLPNSMFRNYKCIVYPESYGGGDFFERLDSLGIPILVSPLHNKDFRMVDGVPRPVKPHFHLLIQLTAKQKYSEVLSWMQPFGVHYLMRVKDIRRDERYWCHLDSKGKAQYDVNDLVCIGGYVCKYLGERYEFSALQQINQIIIEEGIVDYADLYFLLVNNYPELVTYLIRFTAHFNNLFRNMLDMSKSYKTDNAPYVKLAYRRRKFGR